MWWFSPLPGHRPTRTTFYFPLVNFWCPRKVDHRLLEDSTFRFDPAGFIETDRFVGLMQTSFGERWLSEVHVVVLGRYLAAPGPKTSTRRLQLEHTVTHKKTPKTPPRYIAQMANGAFTLGVMACLRMLTTHEAVFFPSFSRCKASLLLLRPPPPTTTTRLLSMLPLISLRPPPEDEEEEEVAVAVAVAVAVEVEVAVEEEVAVAPPVLVAALRPMVPRLPIPGMGGERGIKHRHRQTGTIGRSEGIGINNSASQLRSSRVPALAIGPANWIGSYTLGPQNRRQYITAS